MRGAKQIPVYRGTRMHRKSLREAVTALEQGEAVVIYPEGTITKDPAQWPMEAKTGIARLVLLAPDTPVVPVGQWGAQHRTPCRGGRSSAGRQAGASVGEPLDLSRYRGREPTAETLREITDVIMDAVRVQVAELRDEPAPASVLQAARKCVDKKRQLTRAVAPSRVVHRSETASGLHLSVTYIDATSFLRVRMAQVRPLCRSAGAALIRWGRTTPHSGNP